jgi:hypothetical protein|tara:strand:- start:78 stop:830 length:753 start_codon:yes stop_codon:yes gene_type:complete
MTEIDKVKEIRDISLPFIPDSVLKSEIEIVLNLMDTAIDEIEKDYEENVIDPFVSLFEKTIFDISDNDNWKKSEFQRQLQKTLNNHIGRFHQNIMCSLKDCKEPPEQGTDFMCKKEKIYAEIKNKWNSTNADSKAGSYDKLKHALSKNKKFKGYFVTIIPKNSKDYCKTMTTTSNENKSQWRKPRIDIMEINAEFFYEKLTKKKHVLKSIFYRIPDLVEEIKIEKKELLKGIKEDSSFNYFLLKALGKYD